MKGLLSETIVHWHNLVDNPNDLPDEQLPPMWYEVMIASNFLPEDENKFPWVITEALYEPKEKKWYVAIRPADAPFIEDPYKFDPNEKLCYKEPVGKIVLWADLSEDYVFALQEEGKNMFVEEILNE